MHRITLEQFKSSISKEMLINYYNNNSYYDTIHHFNISEINFCKVIKEWNIKKDKNAIKQLKSASIKNACNNRTKEEKSIISINATNRYNSMTYEEKLNRKNSISKSLKSLSLEAKQNRNDRIALGVKKAFTTDRKNKYAKDMGIRFTGTTPWNKDKHMSLESSNKKREYYHNWTEEERKSFIDKQLKAKKLHNTFNTSNPEDKYYNYLVNKYGEKDIIRQYSSPRYPYACDFYIKSKDEFIELNLHWTHGGKPFDGENKECQIQLSRWLKKSKDSVFYKNAINVWTVTDIQKLNTAHKMQLNYLTLYKYEENKD